MFDLFDKIQVTLEYSNAVLVAILPHVTDFADRLDLSIPLPVTTNHVRNFEPDDDPTGVGGWLILTNGYNFWFGHGHVKAFQTSRSIYPLSHAPSSDMYGEVNLNQAEAIALARSTIRKLGYSEEMLYADLEPKVKIPKPSGKFTIPHYLVEWDAPNRDITCVRIEVNACRKTIEKVFFLNKNLWRAPPELAVKPEIRKSPHSHPAKQMDPARAHEFLAKILPEITDFTKKLNLPIPLPLVTNHVDRFACHEEQEVQRGALRLTNGYVFTYNYGYVQGFEAPDVFFTRNEVKVKDFVGQWKLSQRDAIRLARETTKKLGFDEKLLFLDRKPEITRPNVRGKVTIPRYELRWEVMDRDVLISLVVMEIDGAKGTVKSIWLECPQLAREIPKIPHSTPQSN